MTEIRIGRRAKMLCAECREVNPAHQKGDSDTVYLSCGHSRTPYLLPSNEGTVGLEDLIWNRPRALRLFPTIYDDLKAIDEHYVRENYWK
jgi:hypothetical protein